MKNEENALATAKRILGQFGYRVNCDFPYSVVYHYFSLALEKYKQLDVHLTCHVQTSDINICWCEMQVLFRMTYSITYNLCQYTYNIYMSYITITTAKYIV